LPTLSKSNKSTMLVEMVRATKWFAILNIVTMVRTSSGASDAPIVKHPRIINAQGEGWYLYKPFVSLLDRTGETYCSGVVIGDHEILTAAHCLEDLVPLVARFNDDAPDMDLDPGMYNVNPYLYNTKKICLERGGMFVFNSVDQ